MSMNTCKLCSKARHSYNQIWSTQESLSPGGRTRAASRLTMFGWATRLMSEISFLKLSRSCRWWGLCSLHSVYLDIFAMRVW